jgi:hypothetical protein
MDFHLLVASPRQPLGDTYSIDFPVSKPFDYM